MRVFCGNLDRAASVFITSRMKSKPTLFVELTRSAISVAVIIWASNENAGVDSRVSRSTFGINIEIVIGNVDKIFILNSFRTVASAEEGNGSTRTCFETRKKLRPVWMDEKEKVFLVENETKTSLSISSLAHQDLRGECLFDSMTGPKPGPE